MYASKTRITIVEDNAVVREGFRVILGSVHTYNVVNTYGNCEEMLKNIAVDGPDVVIMDISLPGMDGIQGIDQIKKLDPDVEVIICSIHDNTGLVFKALCAGASGYLMKTSSHIELIRSVEQVIAGGAPMSMRIARMVVASFQRNYNSPLSKRETEVLELLSKGKTYTMIADELFITKETAKSHLKNIYFKLHVHNKTEAIQKATADKLI